MYTEKPNSKLLYNEVLQKRFTYFPPTEYLKSYLILKLQSRKLKETLYYLHPYKVCGNFHWRSYGDFTARYKTL